MRRSYNRPISNRYHAAKESLHWAARLQPADNFLFFSFLCPACYVRYSFAQSAEWGDGLRQTVVCGEKKHVEGSARKMVGPVALVLRMYVTG